MKLEHKVAIVTGAAQGIGRAIARELAEEGADIAVADLDLDQATEAVDEIKALGRKAIAMKVDVTNFTQVKEMVNMTLGEFKKIDILVNNAGGSARQRKSPFYQSTEDVWDFVIGSNLKGVLNCCRAVIEHMMQRRSGKIINIASIAGVVGQIELGDYSAAKAGIVGFSKALAKEVAPHGINVNCVSPGAIATDRILAAMPVEFMEELKKSTGLGRIGKPEEVAYMVRFLASDEANFITGQNFMVCGLMNLPLY
ncbi:SDR family NAD(P)-dependent oxidoreductase [Chloroflexota bacterium]